MDLKVVYLILYVLAAGCFFFYALRGAAANRPNMLGLGVFFWSLVPLIETIHKLQRK